MEAPLAAHGMLHLVITNAHDGDPYPIDTLLHVHDEHGLELGHEHRRHDRDADREASFERRRTASRASFIGRLIPEMVAYADLILPDTTYLERWDCISCSIARSRPPMGLPTAIRQPVLPPIATCGRSRTCCSIWALGSPCRA